MCLSMHQITVYRVTIGNASGTTNKNTIKRTYAWNQHVSMCTSVVITIIQQYNCYNK